MRSNRIVPEPPVLRPEDEESISVWGFSDTAFEMLDGDVVRLSGDRYELAGQELPDLLAWVRDQIHPDINIGFFSGCFFQRFIDHGLNCRLVHSRGGFFFLLAADKKKCHA